MRKRKDTRHALCPDCGVGFSTRSYKPLVRCQPCRKSVDFKRNMLDSTWRLNKLLSMARYRADSKDVPFNIDLPHLINLWDENDGRCLLTNQEFDLTSWGEKGQVNPRTPSIDRIQPALGYTKGNVRLVTYHMNIALSDFGTEEFERLVRLYKGVAA